MNLDPDFVVLMSDGEFYACSDATSKVTAIAEAEKAFPALEAMSVYVRE